ncbi:MAG: rod shape-determining protein RodA [Bacteroidales bacterium]|nr:rod shape-determining protein RodA [Bacteroidales bacterium]
MAQQFGNILQKIDWHIILIYVFLVFAGWINIYSAVFDETAASIVDIDQKYGKQLIWIIAAFILAVSILIIDSGVYYAFADIFYVLVLLALIGVYLFAPEIKGARSWIEIGPFRFQPSEFAKLATCLMVAKNLGQHGVSIVKRSGIFRIGIIVLIPALLIVMQGDAGSALVFASLFLVFYREGMPFFIILFGVGAVLIFSLSIIWGAEIISILSIIGCLIAFVIYGTQKKHKLPLTTLLLVLAAFLLPLVCYIIMEEKYISLLFAGFILTIIPLAVYTYKKKVAMLMVLFGIAFGSIAISQSVDYVFSHILEAHQQKRINVFFGLESDPRGSEFNVIQSKIAIGSGDWFGKGFLDGTQTKNDFVPEQSTDFIFCTIGEEWGFVGSVIVIALFVYLICRIMRDAERQRTKFSRIYGYCVASVLFFHIAVNIGMTIGLMPVIGIPLPFFSYGGSSLWGFTILLFIFVKLDANREQLIQ